MARQTNYRDDGEGCCLNCGNDKDLHGKARECPEKAQATTDRRHYREDGDGICENCGYSSGIHGKDLSCPAPASAAVTAPLWPVMDVGQMVREMAQP